VEFENLFDRLPTIWRKVVMNAQNRLISAGMLTGQRDYARFMILGRSRVGSTYLMRLLNSHPEAVMYPAVYHSIDAKIGRPYIGDMDAPLALRQKDPVAFLDQYIYRDYPGYIRACGFKLFYSHAREASQQPLWSYIERSPEIRIIHLQRKSLLRNIVSGLIARKTGRYIDYRGTPSSKAISLGTDELRSHFERLRRQQARHRETFRHHQVLDIYYEDLVDDFSVQMRNIQRFLGLSVRLDLSGGIRRQNPEPIRDLVVNFDELKLYFEGTEWEWNFR
jgi:LPS sulfotransferase NodH